MTLVQPLLENSWTNHKYLFSAVIGEWLIPTNQLKHSAVIEGR
ncbi:hypothetical protein [Domibacillus enclensis]|uniref:Uncharacterized protein n=1 Tax=Domibacillus enclensis TaxID=1017273 RepID=A0A1N6X0N4_9BACI|nr:hypothetical protein [Domibacillus enclensis]SIQ95909.1 hypothetical protein SAMN05443094_104334 [Domibacillus enclensis]